MTSSWYSVFSPSCAPSLCLQSIKFIASSGLHFLQLNMLHNKSVTYQEAINSENKEAGIVRALRKQKEIEINRQFKCKEIALVNQKLCNQSVYLNMQRVNQLCWSDQEASLLILTGKLMENKEDSCLFISNCEQVCGPLGNLICCLVCKAFKKQVPPC